MEYKQIIQESPKYYFGEGKQFASRELALEKVEKKIQRLKTTLALKRIYHISQVEIKESKDYLQIILKINIPILL